MDYGGSRLHAGLAKMPKWIMEDLGYCTLFCYCTMYSHFHFLWVGSKNMFCTYNNFDNQYSKTNVSLEDFE